MAPIFGCDTRSSSIEVRLQIAQFSNAVQRGRSRILTTKELKCDMTQSLTDDARHRAAEEQTRRAERSLEQAQATIRDLQTKLAQERLAKGEALQAADRAARETRAAQQTLGGVQDKLLDERLARRNAEQEREEVIAARMNN
jgi:hypothetical protein